VPDINSPRVAVNQTFADDSSSSCHRSPGWTTIDRVDRTPPRNVSASSQTAGSARDGPSEGARQDRPADLSAALRQARDGDSHAFRDLYADMQPRLLRYLWALVGADAEDVASETWLHVARDLRSFHGDTDGFRGWVATIGRHRAMDHLRAQRRQPPAAGVRVEDLDAWAAQDNTEDNALAAVATDAAIALIARLPQDQAEAVLLRVVVGLDAAHTARVLGKRPGAVRTASYRGLRRLATMLEPRDEGARAPRIDPGVTSARALALKDMR
jgi:RNA polymerase sigma-70 factor (ECF subfamily)